MQLNPVDKSFSESVLEQKCILIIEDDNDFAESLRQVLISENYHVNIANNLDAVKNELTSCMPHVALIDIRLGMESGIDILQYLTNQHPDIVNIMLTAYANIDTTIESLRLGAHDYLRKPVQMDELLITLQRCFEILDLANEKKLAEQALNDSEENFYKALNASSDIMAITLLENSKIIDVNMAFQRALGWSKNEAFGKTTLELGIFADLSERESAVECLREKGEFTDREIHLRTRSGKIFPVTSSAVIIMINGEPCVCSTSRDITERKVTEQALRENEKRFRSLVNNIPGAVYRCANDSNWTMNFISDAIEEICGYPATDFINNKNRSYASIIHDKDQSMVTERVMNDVKQHQSYELKYRIVDKYSNVHWVYEKGQGVFDHDGNLLYLDGVIFDITESHELSEKLSYFASHDALTGLINRREFENRLQRILDTVHKTKSEHALCYLDLDQFKVINDTCGHFAGDELLRQLSIELQNHARKRDTVARLGGDEFGVLMEHCTLEQGLRLANNLRKTIEDYQFIWEDRGFKIGVSIGLVPINQSSDNITDILKKADSACYMAKDAGRNRIHIYRAEDQDIVKRHTEMQWIARINHALDEGRFRLDFQPIIPLKNATSEKYYEVLIRMVEDGQSIMPGLFLPAAENYNLASKLDRWVINETFSFLANNPALMNEVGFCSINLSGLTLTSPGLLDFIIHMLDDFSIPPEKVCFEITETAAITNLSYAIQFIKQLKDYGCKFALDDFGSGLSSFAYLKTLPVNFLKIDGLFVKDITKDPLDFAMVKSINEIGQAMGKRTVAEFVEDEYILKLLREIGVDYAQGYYIGEPVDLKLSMDN